MSKVNFHNKNEGLKKSPLKILVACGPLNQKGADNKITISQTMEICTNSRKQHAQTSTEVGPDCMQVNDRRLPSNRFQQFGTLQTHSSRVANLNLFFFTECILIRREAPQNKTSSTAQGRGTFFYLIKPFLLSLLTQRNGFDQFFRV